MKAMIFAAGLGTRLKPITDTRPKALVEIGGMTLLQRLMLKLSEAGITEVVVNVHHFADQIIDYLHTNQGFGMQWSISDERDKLLETGGGLKKARKYLEGNEPILVHNVDIISNLDFRKLITSCESSSLATLVVSNRQTQRYLMFDSDYRLRGWQNITTGETRPADLSTSGLTPLAFSGIQVVSPTIFQLMEKCSDKFSIIDTYLDNCADHIIKAYIPQDYKMMDVGKISQLSEAQSFAEHLAAE